MAVSLTWKFHEHKDLIKAGFEHNIFLDFLSTKYRKKSFELWDQLPIVMAKGLGCVFSPRTPIDSLREVFIEEIYNVEGFRPDKGDLVIDVGANYGDSAIWWSRVMGAEVIAFEPLANVFEVLEENVQLNKASVKLHKVAIGNGDEINGYSDGNMFISSSESIDLKFKTMKLDDFNLERVDLLKIDIEGFEYEALTGSIKTLKRFMTKIIIETHSIELKEKCDKLLKSIG